MKLLLAAINAKYIHSNPAVYSLRAYAVQRAGLRGEAVGIAEFTINQTADEILEKLYEAAPDVLAFSCYIWNREMIEKLLLDLPRILPGTEIWLGGPEVSYSGETFLREHPQVRGIMVGEGEITFAELAAWYEETETGAARDLARLSRICGLCYRDREGAVQTTPARMPASMDEFPFLYADLQNFQNRIIYYESSRGCPFSCSYCLSSIDKSVRFRKVERVKEELQFFLDAGVAQVKFVDRTFNCRPSHALEIWRYIQEHDNGVTNFHFEIAAELLNEEELALLAQMRPGLVQMEIGVQSTHPQTLQAIRRQADFDRLSEVVGILQRGANIHLHLDLIAGLPYEDLESFCRSFNDVYRLHPEQLQLGFLKVLQGSEMAARAEEFGLCYRARPPYEVLFSNWISYAELLRLKAVEEALEIYYNSGQFAHTIRRLEREFAHPFALYEALADYCRRQAPAGQKTSRLARFELLRGFLWQRSADVLYEELLLLDVYLREKSKSRPAWAADPGREKERILDFYRREETHHRFLADYAGYSAKQMMHMTHLEHFHYAVLQDQRPRECWLLFDYRRRNPLTGDALAQDVTDWMEV